MQWVYRAKQRNNKRKICLLQKADLEKDVHMFSPGSTVSPSWTHLAWLSHLNVSRDLPQTDYLTWPHTWNFSVTWALFISMAMFWTSRFKLAFGLFSSSSAFGLMHILAEAKIGLKTTKQNNENMIRSSLTDTIELSGAQTKPRTCSRTCGLDNLDQKTHCTGNEGGPCPYCWWNTLTPPARGGGGGGGRKRRKEGRASLVRVQEKFHKNSWMSIIFMDQTNWQLTMRSHNIDCLAFGIIPVCQMFSYSSSLCCESLINSPGIFLRFRHVCLFIHLLPLNSLAGGRLL